MVTISKAYKVLTNRIYFSSADNGDKRDTFFCRVLMVYPCVVEEVCMVGPHQIENLSARIEIQVMTSP